MTDRFSPASLLRLLAFLFLVLGTMPTGWATGTPFTYQGRLTDGGVPANGTYDLRFRLAADSLGNSYVGSPCFTNAVPVANGLFTVTVDFGSEPFVGSNYWLELDVRTNGAVNYTALSPLQAVTPAPYAFFARSASNLLGSVPATQVMGTLQPGQLPAGLITNSQTGATLDGTFSGNGAGLADVPPQRLAFALPYEATNLAQFFATGFSSNLMNGTWYSNTAYFNTGYEGARFGLPPNLEPVYTNPAAPGAVLWHDVDAFLNQDGASWVATNANGIVAFCISPQDPALTGPFDGNLYGWAYSDGSAFDPTANSWFASNAVVQMASPFQLLGNAPQAKLTFNTNFDGYYYSLNLFGRTGSADDTTTFTNALASGLPIYIPYGRYNVSNLTLPSNAQIDGRGATLVGIATNSNWFLLTVPTFARGLSVKNLKLEPAGLPYSPPQLGGGDFSPAYTNLVYSPGLAGTFGGLYVPVDCDDSEIRNITAHGFNGIGICFYGGNTSSTSPYAPKTEFAGLRAQYCAYGFKADSRAEYLTLSGAVASQCVKGVGIACGNVKVCNSQFNVCNIGASVEGGTNPAHSEIVGCTFNHDNVPFQCSGFTQANYGYQFRDNICVAGAGGYYYTSLILNNVSGVVIENNTFGFGNSNQGPGLTITNLTGTNVFRNNTVFGYTNGWSVYIYDPNHGLKQSGNIGWDQSGGTGAFYTDGSVDTDLKPAP